jgi:hypothetical protein
MVRDMVKSIEGKKFKKFNTKTKLCTAKVFHLGSEVVLLTSSEIRAPIGQCVAHGMGHNWKYVKQLDEAGEAIIQNRIVERPCPHRVIGNFRYAFPYPLSNRELLAVNVYEKVSDSEAMVSVTSCEHADCPPSHDFVRMNITRAFILKRISRTITRLDVVTKLDLNGNIPKAVNNQLVIPQTALSPINMVRYFNAVRPANATDAGDAMELGQIFFYDLKSLRKTQTL